MLSFSAAASASLGCVRCQSGAPPEAGLSPVIHSPPLFFGSAASAGHRTRQSSLGPGGFFFLQSGRGLDLPLGCRVNKGGSGVGPAVWRHVAQQTSNLHAAGHMSVFHVHLPARRVGGLMLVGLRRKPAEGLCSVSEEEKPASSHRGMPQNRSPGGSWRE